MLKEVFYFTKQLLFKVAKMPVPKKNPKTAALRQQAKDIHSIYREAANRGLIPGNVLNALAKAQKQGYKPGFRTKRLIVEAWLKNRAWNAKHNELPITANAMLHAAERVPGNHSRILKQFTPGSLKMRKDRILSEFKRPTAGKRSSGIPKKWEITKSGNYITNMYLESVKRACWVEFRFNDKGRIDEANIINFGLVKNGRRVETFYPELEQKAIAEMIIELETQMMEEEREEKKQP